MASSNTRKTGNWLGLGIVLLIFFLIITFLGTRPKPQSRSLLTPVSPLPTLQLNSKRLSIETTAGFNYSIELLDGWKITHPTTPPSVETLRISKNEYSVIIYQPKNRTKVNCQVVYKENNESFQEFKGATGIVFRRSNISPNPKATKNSNSICEKTDRGFMLPTRFGVIEYETPLKPNDQLIGEMDRIIQSLELK